MAGEFLFHLDECITLLPGVKNGGIDMAEADRVPANTMLTEFVRPGASKGTDGCLRRAVNADIWKALDRRNRSVQDDRSPVLHQRKSLLHREKEPLHVCVEVKMEEFLVNGAELSYLGIREDHVDLTVLF
jgi:hypothetical protein